MSEGRFQGTKNFTNYKEVKKKNTQGSKFRKYADFYTHIYLHTYAHAHVFSLYKYMYGGVAQSPSDVRLFVTPWTA